MKNLFSIALLFVTITTFAQKKTERKEVTNEEKVEKKVSKLTESLKLNDKQIGEIKLLLTNDMEKNNKKKTDLKAKIKANKEAGIAMSDEDKKSLRALVTEQQEFMKTELKKILTEEQFIKWETIKAEKKEKMKAKKNSEKIKQ